MIEWNEQQQMIQKMVRDFVAKEVVPNLDDIEYNGVPPYDILRKMIKTFGMDVMATQNYEKQIASLLFRGTFDLMFTDAYEPSQNLDSRVTQDAFVKLNLRLAIGAPDGRWELALLGRNLTDETIVTYANDTPLAFSQFRSPSFYGFVDRPRSIAVQGSFRFP